MEPRLRAGLLAGAGAAIATLLLSLALFWWFVGPLVAILVGVNVGLQLARDTRYTHNTATSAALSGFYAGLLIGVAQIAGMILFLSTPAAKQAINQVIETQNLGYSMSFVTLSFTIFSFVLAIIDIGIAPGVAAGMAYYVTRQRAPIARRYPAPPVYYNPMPPPEAYSPPPVPPPIVASYAPPPAYPPPPGFYGYPDAIRDASPPESDTPANDEATTPKVTDNDDSALAQ
jgi:hypothetical protein